MQKQLFELAFDACRCHNAQGIQEKTQDQEENISDYSIVINSATSEATIYQQGDTGKVT